MLTSKVVLVQIVNVDGDGETYLEINSMKAYEVDQEFPKPGEIKIKSSPKREM